MLVAKHACCRDRSKQLEQPRAQPLTLLLLVASSPPQSSLERVDELDPAGCSHGRLQQLAPTPLQPDILSWDLDLCSMRSEDLVCCACSLTSPCCADCGPLRWPGVTLSSLSPAIRPYEAGGVCVLSTFRGILSNMCWVEQGLWCVKASAAQQGS